MMKLPTALMITTLLPAIALLSNCEKKNTGTSTGPVSPPTSTVQGDYPKLVRAWVGDGGLEQSDALNAIAYNPKTSALIEERFKEMDWNNAQAKASFAMQLDAERSLRFISASEASTGNSGFVAIWTRPGKPVAGATTAILKKSRPLPGAAEALQLLNTYVTSDGDIQSAVEWAE